VTPIRALRARTQRNQGGRIPSFTGARTRPGACIGQGGRPGGWQSAVPAGTGDASVGSDHPGPAALGCPATIAGSSKTSTGD
jgi:hypothetical protein